MKRFLLGTAVTVGLALIPYSAYVAISAWCFGQYDAKFGAYGTWLLATQIAGIIAIGAFIAFAVAFPLLNRLTQSQGGWRYVITIAAPVAMLYVLMATGIVPWLVDLINPSSFAGCVPVAIIAYLPGLAVATGIAMIRKKQNHHARRWIKK